MNAGAWPEAVAYVLAMWFLVRPLGVRWARAAAAWGVITAAHQGRLTGAFEALGPERVAHGLAARGHSWWDCFVALAAFGEATALGRARGGRRRFRGARFYSTLLGTSPAVIQHVADTWDRNEAAFRELAGAWLEQRAAPVAHATDVLMGARRS